MKTLKFPSTAGFGDYKQFFSKESVAHPAKMNLELLKWIIETFTEKDETVLDPMAGTGSTVVMASLLNRNGVGVELEPHFYRMMVDNKALAERTSTLTPKGSMRMIQGDSRELSKILGEADVVITSPPYAETDPSASHMVSKNRANPNNPNYRPSWKRKISEGYLETKRPYSAGVDAVITSPPYESTIGPQGGRQTGHPTKEDIEKPMGDSCRIQKYDAVITSPPYSEGTGHGGGKKTKILEEKKLYLHGKDSYSVDAIVTSPPYADLSVKANEKLVERMGKDYENGKNPSTQRFSTKNIIGKYEDYNRENKENIGNLKGASYWSEMAKIYLESWKVLKPEGKMVLVLKNFIRQKKIVDLAGDTVKLCESLDFTLVERCRFKLPTKSFWRVLYSKKHPEVDAGDLDYEHILVFRKDVRSR